MATWMTLATTVLTFEIVLMRCQPCMPACNCVPTLKETDTASCILLCEDTYHLLRLSSFCVIGLMFGWLLCLAFIFVGTKCTLNKRRKGIVCVYSIFWLWKCPVKNVKCAPHFGSSRMQFSENWSIIKSGIKENVSTDSERKVLGLLVGQSCLSQGLFGWSLPLRNWNSLLHLLFEWYGDPTGS